MSDLLRRMDWSEFDIRDIETLKARIAAGADVNKVLPQKFGHQYPLEVAAYYGNLEACKLLLEAGAKLEKRYGPIVVAIEGRASTLKDAGVRRFSREVMENLIKTFVQAGAHPDGDDVLTNNIRYVRMERSPLFMAIQSADTPAVKALMELGADIELPVDAYSIQMGVDGRRGMIKALQYASELGRHQTVALLIKAGANEDCFFNTKDGMNALQVCVRRGHCAAVDYLVRERGEDLAQRFNGRTMLQWAHPKDSEMKALLNSLKTELAVQKGVEIHVDLAGQAGVATNRSLAL